MNLAELYNTADRNNIKVDCFRLNNQPCLSVQDNNYNCYIAVDPVKLKSEKQERELLAHELGHCMTGAFYTCSSPLQVRGQMEWRATLWAIKKLIPKTAAGQLMKL